MVKSIAWACALLTSLAVAVAADLIHGTFALQGGSISTVGYLKAVEIHGDPLALHLDTWLTPRGSDTPIRSYGIDMTKRLHMIIVTDDFRTFLHVHPTLQSDGHFLLDQTLPRVALYHIYSDTQPNGRTKQVFRFDVGAGTSVPAAARDLSERALAVKAGPYWVRLSSNTLVAGSEAHVVIHILKNGEPATDLHPYLGAAAHAVFLNARDLSYVHAHPMPIRTTAGMHGHLTETDMTQMPPTAISPPNMMLHVALSEPGIYKLWLQFHGGTQLYVAEFVITAS
jgi:hypothetical protein